MRMSDLIARLVSRNGLKITLHSRTSQGHLQNFAVERCLASPFVHSMFMPSFLYNEILPSPIYIKMLVSLCMPGNDIFKSPVSANRPFANFKQEGIFQNQTNCRQKARRDHVTRYLSSQVNIIYKLARPGTAIYRESRSVSWAHLTSDLK